MGTKANPGAYDCYAKLKDDEPHFVLMGRDPLAGTLVRAWAGGAVMRLDGHLEREGRDKVPADYVTREQAKISEANRCADAMDAYCRANGKLPARWTTKAPIHTHAGLPRDVLRALVVEALNHGHDTDADEIIAHVPGVKVSE